MGGLSATITALKLAGVGIVLVGLGFFVWNYQHMKTVIADKDRQIAGLQEAARVAAESAKTTQEVRRQQAVPEKRIPHEQALNHEAATIGPADDYSHIFERARQLGVRIEPPGGNPAGK